MTPRFTSLASAACMLIVAAAASGQAQAQNYDGDGRLRFGAFVQGSDLEFDVQRPAIAAGTASSEGLGGGASFGYDVVLRDRLVLGLEADGSIEDSSDKNKGRSFASDYLVTLRGRLGAHLHPGWLVYGTGGAAFLGVEYQHPSFLAPAFASPAPFSPAPLTVVPAAKFSETLTGWTVGGGTEVDLHGIILFAEYLYADFDTFDFTNSKEDAVPGAPFVPARYAIDVDQQLVRVGVKFKIGHDFYHDDVRSGRLK